MQIKHMELKEIIKALTTQQVGYNKTTMDRYEDVGYKLLEDENVGFKHGKYTFDFEEDFGGEGSGDAYWVVFSVYKDHYKDYPKKYYKIPGHYASYCGGELSPYRTFEVEPKEKVVRDWLGVADKK